MAHRGLIASAFFACLLFLFYPGWIHSQVPAFRDAFHFYYPQAVWLDQCAMRGEYFPLWNSQEGFGSSVAGQTSSALFYPLRLVWHLPLLSVAQRFAVFVMLHLILAASGICYASSKLGLSRRGTQLAAIGYTLSCPVLFQHNNLIYLCSAAWIGFALGAIVEVCREARQGFRSCAVFSGGVSMMLLCGDPHTAFNTMLVAVMAFAANYWRLRRRGAACLTLTNDPNSNHSNSARPSVAWLRAMRWLCIAAGIVVATTAIQWIPTMRWARSSGRVSASAALSLQGHAAQSAALRELESLAMSVKPAVHRVYDFSLPPWHVTTMLWPTLGGNYLPNNSRWFAMLPAEGRMWLPSLYFGFLPCLLVLAAFRRTASARTHWLLGLAVLALIAALGNYSLIWLARELLGATGLQRLASSLPADHAGSLYACFAWSVPGYDAFRYPAKWTTWLVAACSLVAASRLDDAGPALPFNGLLPRRFWPVFFGTSAIIAIVAVFLWVGGTDHPFLMSSTRGPDAWLGPPTYQAVAVTLLFAWLVPCLCLVAILRAGAAWKNGIVMITLVEMTLIATNWICFVDAPVSQDRFGQEQISASRPLIWANNSEADIWNDRLRLGNQPFCTLQSDYQTAFLLGKLSAIEQAGSIAASQSIKPQFADRLTRWLARNDDLSSTQPQLDRVLGLMGATHRLVRLPDSTAVLQWQPVPNSRPLCEAFEPGSNAVQAELEWSWPTSSELLVSISTPGEVVLLVRQYNDGGWSASLEQDGKAPRHLALESSLGSLLELQLPAGLSTLRLKRKWFW